MGRPRKPKAGGRVFLRPDAGCKSDTVSVFFESFSLQRRDWDILRCRPTILGTSGSQSTCPLRTSQKQVIGSCEERLLKPETLRWLTAFLWPHQAVWGRWFKAFASMNCMAVMPPSRHCTPVRASQLTRGNSSSESTRNCWWSGGTEILKNLNTHTDSMRDIRRCRWCNVMNHH